MLTFSSELLSSFIYYIQIITISYCRIHYFVLQLKQLKIVCLSQYIAHTFEYFEWLPVNKAFLGSFSRDLSILQSCLPAVSLV